MCGIRFSSISLCCRKAAARVQGDSPACSSAWDRRYRQEQRERFIGKRHEAVLFVEVGSFIVDGVNDNALNADGFSGADDCIERVRQKVFAEALTFVVLVNGEPCQEHCGYIPGELLARHALGFHRGRGKSVVPGDPVRIAGQNRDERTRKIFFLMLLGHFLQPIIQRSNAAVKTAAVVLWFQTSNFCFQFFYSENVPLRAATLRSAWQVHRATQRNAETVPPSAE